MFAKCDTKTVSLIWLLIVSEMDSEISRLIHRTHLSMQSTTTTTARAMVNRFPRMTSVYRRRPHSSISTMGQTAITRFSISINPLMSQMRVQRPPRGSQNRKRSNSRCPRIQLREVIIIKWVWRTVLENTKN